MKEGNYIGKKTQEQYVDELAIKNPDIEVIEPYINARTSILHYCHKHDIIWKISPDNALHGKGCSGCLSEKLHNRFIKSHDQYVKEVKNINPLIEVIGKYTGANTPILHHCIKHDIIWEPFPSNILKGYGCIECGKEKYLEKRIKPHDDYIRELYEKNPHLEVVEEYAGAKTPIMHHCKIHDIYWKTTPNNALKNDGCPECKNDYMRELLGKTHEQYLKEVAIINSDIEVVGKYINAKEKIMHHCLKHDVYWEALPDTILNGGGCYECRSEKIIKANTVSNEEYVSHLKEINPTVINLEPYANMKTPILHKCLKHDVSWVTTPCSVLQGAGCPKCRSEKISSKILKTHNEYVEELSDVNPFIKVLEEYSGSTTPILHKCMIDGNEWYTTPANILHGYGCPRCNESKGERKIRLWLTKNNIKFVFQKKFVDCRNVKPLPFDFYLPEYNVAIEYDGKQHFEPVDFFGGGSYFEATKKNDSIKTEYCKNNGIPLLRIPYFKNVEEELEQFLFI